MRNKKRVLENTTDSRVYKLTAREGVMSCPICPPHRGCNRDYFGVERNWKKFRKTQYKIKGLHEPRQGEGGLHLS